MFLIPKCIIITTWILHYFLKILIEDFIQHLAKITLACHKAHIESHLLGISMCSLFIQCDHCISVLKAHNKYIF